MKIKVMQKTGTCQLRNDFLKFESVFRNYGF